MLNDGFKKNYGSVPIAIYRADPSAPSDVLLHWHREAEIIASVAGAVTFYVDGAEYRLARGDMLIIPPCALHRASVPGGADYMCICFDVHLLCDRELVAGLLDGTVGVTPYIGRLEADAPQLFRLAADAFSACEERDDGWELGSVGSLMLFFRAIKARGAVTAADPSGRDKEFCMSVLGFIADNYGRALTSRDAAEFMYMSSSYFCRSFKRNFGIKFSLYLLSYRIERAKALLRESKMSVSEVAEHVGFSDFSYFAKMFRQSTGMTPRAYRRRTV